MVGELKIGFVGDIPDGEQIRRNPWNLHYQVIRAAKAEGAHLVIFSVSGPSGPIANLCDAWRLWKPIFRRSQLPTSSLLRMIKREAVDLLIFNMGATSILYAPWYARSCPRLLGLLTTPIYRPSELLRAGMWTLTRDPLGSRVHFLTPLCFSRRGVSRLNKLNLTVVALSRRNTERLVDLGYRQDFIRTILPAISAEFLALNNNKPPPEERDTSEPSSPRFRFLYMGSPTDMRGARMVVQAFAVIADKYPHARLMILSRPDRPGILSYSQSLMNLVLRKGCQTKTSMIERYLRTEEILDILSKSDAVLLPFRLVPSDLPISILEAMALGKPVVSTDLDGIPELLGHGRGIIVEPSDVSGLIEGMIQLIDDTGYARELGRNAGRYFLNRYANENGQEVLQRIIRECGEA